MPVTEEDRVRSTNDALARSRIALPHELKGLYDKGFETHTILAGGLPSLRAVIESDRTFFKVEVEVQRLLAGMPRESRTKRYTEVSFNPEHLATGKPSTDRLGAFEAIEKYSQEIQKMFPNARAILLPAAMYAQLDLGYWKIKERPLLQNIHAWTLDQASATEALTVRHVKGEVHDHALRIEKRKLAEVWVGIRAVPGIIFVSGH